MPATLAQAVRNSFRSGWTVMSTGWTSSPAECTAELELRKCSGERQICRQGEKTTFSAACAVIFDQGMRSSQPTLPQMQGTTCVRSDQPLAQQGQNSSQFHWTSAEQSIARRQATT